MTVPTRLPGGELAELTGWDRAREVLVLVSPRAFAPGAPLRVALLLGPTEELALDLRATGSRRTEAGHFTVQARPVNLTRENRARLSELFSPPTG